MAHIDKMTFAIVMIFALIFAIGFWLFAMNRHDSTLFLLAGICGLVFGLSLMAWIVSYLHELDRRTK